MPARREAHDPDAVRQQAILGRLGAHRADGPLRVAEFHRMVIFRPQPVLQHEGRHPQGIQPPRDLVAFLIHGKTLVAAAGTHDHGRTGSAPRRHHVRRQGRLVDILRALCAGRASRPQQFGLRQIGRLVARTPNPASNANNRTESLIGFLRYHPEAQRRPRPLRQSSNALLEALARGVAFPGEDELQVGRLGAGVDRQRLGGNGTAVREGRGVDAVARAIEGVHGEAALLVRGRRDAGG